MTDTQTDTEAITLEYFDPAALLIDVNVRTDAAATVDGKFTASIKATNGNLQPVLLVRTADGRLRVWDGARRTIACERARTRVAGIILGDEGDDQTARRARIIQQIIINDDHLPLPASDRAAGMLALFETEGMTVAGIAKATGRKKGEVTATLTVARSPVAAGAADRWDLTLDQAAVLAEFDTDKEALAALVAAAKADPGTFGHVAQRMRDSATERAQKATLVAELVAAGYQVTDDWQGPRRGGWHNLGNWLNADGTGITEESHATCPHRAVRIEAGLTWPAEAEAAWRADPGNAEYLAELRETDGLGPDEDPGVGFDDDEDAVAAGWVMTWVTGQGYCTDPSAAGHKDRYTAGPGMSYGSTRVKPEPGTEEAEKAKEERRRVLKGNKDWRSATEVRLTHLKTLLSRKSLTPKPLTDAAGLLVAEAIARGEAAPEKTGEGHKLACQLLGLGDPGYGGRDTITAALEAATPARRQVIALGMILAGTEGEDSTWGCCADVHTWQRAADRAKTAYGNSAFHSGPDRAGRYLAWLEKHTGYVLTELERLVAHGQPETPPLDAPDSGSGAGSDPAGEPYRDDPGDRTDEHSAVDVAPAVVEIDAGGGIPDAHESPATRRQRLINEEVIAGLRDAPSAFALDTGTGDESPAACTETSDPEAEPCAFDGGEH